MTLIIDTGWHLYFKIMGLVYSVQCTVYSVQCTVYSVHSAYSPFWIWIQEFNKVYIFVQDENYVLVSRINPPKEELEICLEKF